MHSKTMKNDLIKSIYDLEEKPENIGRRDFLKKAGIAGLALAGLGSLGGCATSIPVKIGNIDYNYYDLVKIAREYETGKRQVIPINSLEDFALSGEELGGMTPAWPQDRTILGRISDNPFKGNSNFYSPQKYSPQKVFNTSLPEEWSITEYTGRTDYPHYQFFLFVDKFKSTQEFLDAEKKMKNWFFERKEIHQEIKKIINSPEDISPKKWDEWHNRRAPFHEEYFIISKEPFIARIGKGFSLTEKKQTEHLSRLNLYQKKRGLDLVWSDFE